MQYICMDGKIEKNTYGRKGRTMHRKKCCKQVQKETLVEGSTKGSEEV